MPRLNRSFAVPRKPIKSLKLTLQSQGSPLKTLLTKAPPSLNVLLLR